MLNKLKILKEAPVFRYNGGWLTSGIQPLRKETRTPAQLAATIEALAEKNPAVKEFVKSLKKLSPKYMALASDTIELAGRQDLTITNVKMNKINSETGKSLLQYLLGAYIKASKENPKALDFAQEVLDATDTLTSKYFLASFAQMFEHPEAAEHIEAAKYMIRPIAEQTINGFPTVDFRKQENFMNYIWELINKKSKPNKIKLLPKLMEIADKIPGKNALDLDVFVQSEARIERVMENMNVLEEVGKNAHSQGKEINIVDFLTNNINLK